MPQPPSVAFQQWDIWQVDWKHEDGQSKPRPAVLASTPAYASASGLVWCMKVSGVVGRDPVVISLDPATPECSGTGLDKPCSLYIANLQVLPIGALVHRRGNLPGPLALRALTLLLQVSGLHPP